MIGVFEALDWLNVIEGRSRLTAEEARLSMTARIVSLSEEEVRTALRRLRNEGLASADPLERAEVFLHLAAIEFWRRWFAQAARDADEANLTYRTLTADDLHRRAVASWILGMAQWELFQNNEAYTNCDEARTVFLEARRQSNWYQEPARRMQIDLMSRPEEIFAWLNRFQGSNLTPPSWQIIRAARENIRQRRYSDARELLADLQEINRWSRGSFELAEACVECGLTAYQVGPLAIAITLIEKAILDFAPGIGNNHQQVVGRCMLGALECRENSRQRNARLCWTRCLIELEELEFQADRDNNQIQRTWYAECRDLLDGALLDDLAWANGWRP
jgi:tetratricopeptide (TPR) repeat protein